MTVKEALAKRIPRVRDKKWGPTTYLRLPLLPEGGYGPWAELYDDVVQWNVLHERPGSQRVTVVSLFYQPCEPYTGPKSPYESDVKNFACRYAEE
jgi:hypothetical protein